MIEADLLIVGAGAAGAAAAIAVAKEGAQVLLATKGIMGKTGISPLAQGAYQAMIHPGDSPEAYFKDTVEGGRLLSDQNLVSALVEGSAASVKELEAWGVPFQKEGGKLVARFSPGQSFPRSLTVEGRGFALMAALKKQARAWPNIRLLQDLLALKILSDNGRACGAVALNIRSGELTTLSARAVILATGGDEELWGFSDTGPDSLGDGQALALAAGAELVDMEMTLFYPTVILYPECVRGVILIYELFIHPDFAAGRMVNAKGEEFLPGGTMPLRDEMVKAMALETKEGRATERGGLFLDLTKSTKPKDEVSSWVEKSGGCHFLKEMGLDPLSQPLEVAPATHFTLGGIRINERAETSLPGLFAAGECAANLHGANRLSGNALAEAIIFGIIAGKNAATFARETSLAKIRKHEIDEIKEKVAHLREPKKQRFSPHRLKKDIKVIMDQDVGLNRSQAGLSQALVELQALASDVLPRLSAVGPEAFNLSLVDALEAEFMLSCAGVVTQSALLRQETRGHQFRHDFPQQDDCQWLKHTLAKKDGKKLIISTAPVIVTAMVIGTQRPGL